MPTEKMTKRELFVGSDQSAPLRVKLIRVRARASVRVRVRARVRVRVRAS